MKTKRPSSSNTPRSHTPRPPTSSLRPRLWLLGITLVFAFPLSSTLWRLTQTPDPSAPRPSLAPPPPLPRNLLPSSPPSSPRPTPPTLPPPDLRTLQAAFRQLDAVMLKQALPFGRFADGSRLLGLPLETTPDPRHPREKPRSLSLWRLSKDGRYQALDPGKPIASAKIAPHTEAILAITPDREILLSKTSSPASPADFAPIATNADFHPAFSADGQSLAYSRQIRMDEHEVFLRDLASGKTTKLFQADASTPIFSPQGDAIVYTSNRSGWYSLWKFPLPKGPPLQLTNRGLPIGQGIPPGFVPSPIEGRILWGGEWLVFDAGSGLWAVRDDGSNAFRIADPPLWFEWLTPGRLLSYALTEGSSLRFSFP